MRTAFKLILLTLTLCPALITSAQFRASINYFDSIKNYDLSKLWRADSIQAEGDGEKNSFPEPLGYIGNNYQRFYIHYITVTKNRENAYQYKIYGKTKVKDNICSFNGTITVKRAMLFKESDDPRYTQGAIVCDVIFYEDTAKTSAGLIKGTLTSNFYLDKTGEPLYDALMLVGDGYYNNQCIATWKSYKTGVTKKCNWGDYRMPESEELDNGAGDVVINKKYIKNGWETFVAAYSADDKKAREAFQIEKVQWWR